VKRFGKIVAGLAAVGGFALPAAAQGRLPNPVNRDYPQRILSHNVVLGEGRLQAALPLDSLLLLSMRFVVNCPETVVPSGESLPWYLVTSQLEDDGSFMENQNNQGGNFFFAMESFRRYYAFFGDGGALAPCTALLERINRYLTPSSWYWGGMPRTQDDTPDGVYEDTWGEPDKMSMFALGCIYYSLFTGERKYYAEAERIAGRLFCEITPGDSLRSPLPFRVDLESGEVIDPYTSNWIFAVRLADELLSRGTSLDRDLLSRGRRALLDWLMEYPLRNGKWSGYFEDVHSLWHDNINQFSPLESARYFLEHVDDDPRYREAALDLLRFVKGRFGVVSRYGATSICEQDVCFSEMGSHTARYASVAAKAFDVTGDAYFAEEARASLCLASYSACNSFIGDSLAVNPTGIGYSRPWFSDSYFDYMTHFLYAFSFIPSLVPSGNHMVYSSSVIRHIDYGKDWIEYAPADSVGEERIVLDCEPTVLQGGVPMGEDLWKYSGGILEIRHTRNDNIKIIPKK